MRRSAELSKMGYDIMLLISKFKNDSRFKDYPIFKQGELFSIYIESSEEKRCIINGLEADKFKEIEFPDVGKISILRGHEVPQKVYDVIGLKKKKDHVASSSTEMKVLIPLPESLSPELVAFKNDLQTLRQYSYSIQKFQDRLVIRCKSYRGSPQKARSNLARLAQSFKSAMTSNGIKEEQYEMEVKNLTLTTLTIIAKPIKLAENPSDILDNIATLFSSFSEEICVIRKRKYFILFRSFKISFFKCSRIIQSNNINKVSWKAIMCALNNFIRD